MCQRSAGSGRNPEEDLARLKDENSFKGILIVNRTRGVTEWKGGSNGGISIYRRSERKFSQCAKPKCYTANSKTIARKCRIQERKDKVRPVGHSKNVVFDSNLVSH